MKKLLPLFLALTACTASFNPVPPPAPQPPPVSPPAPPPPAQLPVATNFSGKVVSSSEVDLSWTDASQGKAGYRIESISTVGRENHTNQDFPAGTTSFKFLGLNANWQYDFTLSTLDANGIVIAPVSTVTLQLQNVVVVPPPAPPVVVTPPPSTVPVPPSQLGAVTGTPVQIPAGANLATVFSTAKSGQLLVLASGAYSVTSDITLPAGVNMKGPTNAVINVSGSGMIRMVGSSRIDGLTVSGNLKALYLQGSGDMITNCTINGSEISFEPGPTNGKVVGNIFNDAHIYGYSPFNFDISYNTSNHSTKSDIVHLTWFGFDPNKPTNVTITHNIWSDTTGPYIMEMQGTPNGLDISHNWAGNWESIPTFCFVTTYSIATGKDLTSGIYAHNVNVHDNVFGSWDGLTQSSGCGGPGGPFEIMGDNIQIVNNVTFGKNWSGWGLVEWTTPAWALHGNVLVGGSNQNGYGTFVGYQAPAIAPNNKLAAAGSIAFPPASWAFTNDPTPGVSSSPQIMSLLSSAPVAGKITKLLSHPKPLKKSK